MKTEVRDFEISPGEIFHAPGTGRIQQIKDGYVLIVNDVPRSVPATVQTHDRLFLRALAKEIPGPFNGVLHDVTTEADALKTYQATGLLSEASPEAVEHPKHYNKHPSGVECIDIVQHMSFNCGNAVKYIWRADLKHESPIQDLQKAIEYLKFEIDRLQKAAQK